jgi:tRNA1Val (adenine37-N6)-methyltransferase
MSVFKFKEFSIIQEKSAMKVGTDGVLLGSWVSCEKASNILDIGCGTGLITLMLGQRNLYSNVTGIEIDKIASQEAQLNISNSDWEERIEIKHTCLQHFTPQIKFDLIVSNPPFFSQNKSQKSRDIARHTNTLSFEELIDNAAKLLAKKGIFSVIIPKDSEEYFCKISAIYKLYCNRVCYVKGNEKSDMKRVMMEFSFIKSIILTEHLTIERSRHNYTSKYIQLCKDFYLKM